MNNDIERGTFKENIVKAFHILGIVHSVSKIYFYSFIIKAIIKSILPYVTIFFTYLILDGIIDGIDKVIILRYVLIMISLNFLLTLLNHIFDYLAKKNIVDVNYNLDNKIALKTFDIDYDVVEDAETMSLIQKAKDGSNGHGGIKQYCEYIIDNILASFLSIIYGIIILSGLFIIKDTTDTSLMMTLINSRYSLIILGIAMLIPSFISNIVMKIENKKAYDVMMMNIDINKRFGYFYQISSNYQYGKDIRLYNMQPMLEEIMTDEKFSVESNWVEYAKTHAKLMSINYLGNKFLTFIAYLFVGLKAIYGLISIGNVVSFVGSITLISAGISQIIQRYSKVYLYNNYLENYFTFLNIKSTKKYGNVNEIDLNNLSIEFRDVYFKYPNQEEYTLKGINLKIEHGKKLAIVGLNGAGKTTLIKLLCRLYEPNKGDILINDINISDYTKEVMHKLYSVVFQDFKLFSYSILENVSACTKGNEDKVLESLTKAGIKERVEEMPENINTILYQRNKDNGVEISGGEAQKIAIARALYKDSPIVILDEPTAALDPKSEAEIYEKFNELVTNKTSIFISHRMSSCKFCDEIAVINKGEIEELGNHKYLLSKKGLYSQMWNAQAKYYHS